jgi:hypothetical protein
MVAEQLAKGMFLPVIYAQLENVPDMWHPYPVVVPVFLSMVVRLLVWVMDWQDVPEWHQAVLM